MFENKSLLDIFQMGGWVMYVLLGCSILSVAVFIGKEIELWKKSKPSRLKVMKDIRDLLEKKELEKARSFCNASSHSTFCNIVAAGLAFYGKSMREIEDAVSRQITSEIADLEKRTLIIGTIANIAVYIGLFGTVLGIVNAFHGIANSEMAGLNAVIGGVSEALLNTAAGLAVAIPAVVFFNSVMKQIKGIGLEMDSVASELLIILDSGE
ncbi:MAG: MotA/TolQ/ExbB proton channel family protein [Syntrophobacteraceae bacterium]